MFRPGSLDIESLRKRILRGGSAPSTRPAAPSTVSPHRHRRGAVDLPGGEHTTELGSFHLHSKFLPNEHMHGHIRVQALQSLTPSSLTGVSEPESEAPLAGVERWAYLDTETTGLAGGTGTYAFLIGIAHVEASGLNVELFFLRDLHEEAAALSAVANHLSRFDVLLTYNGRSYDVPLLETRYRLQRQSSPFDRMHHIDLLHPARRVWKNRLPNCRLATLESEILGYERQGDVPGALIPQRYFDYLRSGIATPLRPVFEHNILDLVTLACLGTVLLPALAAPRSTTLRHGEDLLGLAQWLQKRRNHRDALEMYRKAIQAGLPVHSLCQSVWESATLERRNGNFSKHVALLHDLARVENGYRVAALEQLAKHYEHRERDYETALQLTREAQCRSPSAALEHREQRLLRKRQGHPQPQADVADRDIQD